MTARSVHAAEAGAAQMPGAARGVAALKRWMIETALPLWATAGFDQRHGAFHERLTRNATADLAAARRVRVQARQIYVYAHAAVLGWYPRGLDAARRAFEFLLERYRSPDGRPGFVHSLAPDGTVAAPLRDLYDHAFILLALAWLARATGDAQVDGAIGDTLAFLDEHLAAGDGTFLEGRPASEPRRQNPHMHLFEAALALHETIGYPGALQRVAHLRELLTGKFIDARTGFLLEYFTADWRPWPEPEGALVEPGHHAEWSWLLRTHERLARLPPDPLASELLRRAVRGADPTTGMLVDAIDRDGNIRRASRRCWPQTELAKAWLAEAEIGGAGAADQARRALAGLTRDHLAGPLPGLWFDQLDAGGRPVGQHVPASTLYHLFGAVVEAERVLGGDALGGPTQSRGG